MPSWDHSSFISPALLEMAICQDLSLLICYLQNLPYLTDLPCLRVTMRSFEFHDKQICHNTGLASRRSGTRYQLGFTQPHLHSTCICHFCLPTRKDWQGCRPLGVWQMTCYRLLKTNHCTLSTANAIQTGNIYSKPCVRIWAFCTEEVMPFVPIFLHAI